MAKSPKNIWFENESNEWFERNKHLLGIKQDLILLLLDLYRIKPERVLEIGCVNGYRLAKIYEKYNSEVLGIEPSEKAIEDGTSKWPFIKFQKAMCDDFNVEGNFDLIISNFVFHWISRDTLIKSIYKIDECVRNEGFLIIGDFGPEAFMKRKYHHLPDENIYTYKQLYQELFTSTGLYREIAKLTFNADTGELTACTNYSDIGIISLLKKIELYIE